VDKSWIGGKQLEGQIVSLVSTNPTPVCLAGVWVDDVTAASSKEARGILWGWGRLTDGELCVDVGRRAGCSSVCDRLTRGATDCITRRGNVDRGPVLTNVFLPTERRKPR
jgi:hypothetical protein